MSKLTIWLEISTVRLKYIIYIFRVNRGIYVYVNPGIYVRTHSNYSIDAC